MSKYDAVVIGGGPAGSSCAKYLSERGLKVALIEKKKYPRFKLCGGALSSRINKYLEDDFKKEVLNVINKGVLGYRGKEYVEKEKSEVAYIIDRSSFDKYLSEKAQEKGTEVYENTEFLNFHEEKGKLIVNTSRGILTADFLIGADGFYSKVSKILGFKKRKYYRSIEFTAEGEMDFNSVVIEIGLVKRGYLWIFPKGDLLNVGIATTHNENLNEIIHEYLKKQKIVSINKTHKPRGWFIPFSEGKKDIHYGKGNVLLVGDAGNFVDPLLGEGIYYAYLSGILAGKSIIENPSNPLKTYKKLSEEIAKEFKYAGKIANLAYRFQKVAFKMGSGYTLENYMELLKGKRSYKEIYIKGWPSFLLNFIEKILST